VTPVPPVQATALLQKRFAVDGGPDYLAVTRDAVWVKADDGRLHRIDPATNRVTSIVRVGTELCQGLGSSGDAVWACDDAGVARVDSRTGRVTARAAVGHVGEPQTIPLGHGRIWVVAGDNSTLLGLDPVTGDVVTRTPLGRRCGSVAVTAATVWVSCRNDDVVLQVDPARGTVRGSGTRLEAPDSVSGSGDFLVVAYRDGVARLDATTGAVTDAVRVSTEFGSVLATAEGVWVRAKFDFLRELDPVTLALRRDVRSREAIAGSVAVGFGSVWVSGADDNAGTVQRLRLR
jgi:outer membrane protein assembly factor BamB